MPKTPTTGKPLHPPQPTKPRPAPAPLSSRLQLKPGQRILLLAAPDGFTLNPLPDGAIVHIAPEAAATLYDAVLLFVRDQAAVEAEALTALGRVVPGGLLWLAYPKRGGAIVTDINRDRGWQTVTAAGWDGVRQIAIDATWSALRFRPLADIRRRA